MKNCSGDLEQYYVEKRMSGEQMKMSLINEVVLKLSEG